MPTKKPTPNRRNDATPKLVIHKDRLHTRGTRMRGRDVAFNRLLMSQVRSIHKDVTFLIAENIAFRKEINFLRSQLSNFKWHYHNRDGRHGRNPRR